LKKTKSKMTDEDYFETIEDYEGEYIDEGDEFFSSLDSTVDTIIHRASELGDLIGSLADYTDCAKCKREIEKLVEVVEYLIDDVELFREHMPERQAVKYKRKESGEYLPLWRKVIGRIL